MLTFRHYIQTCEELIAFNTAKNPFNPWVSIHAPLALRNAPGYVFFVTFHPNTCGN